MYIFLLQKPEAEEDAVRKLPENHYFDIIELVYGSQGNYDC